MKEQKKQALLQMSRRSYAEALFAGTSGNLSVYDRESEIMMITPSSVSYETMEEQDIVLMKLDGEIIEGTKKPSSEWKMHAKVYKERPDVGAVVHTHSPYATSFAVNGESIPTILIEMVPFLGGDVKVADFAMPGSEDMGTQALKMLSDRNACLLANHGVLVIGDHLEQAHIRAIYVEDAAKIYSLAKTNGEVKTVPKEFVEMMERKSLEKKRGGNQV